MKDELLEELVDLEYFVKVFSVQVELKIYNICVDLEYEKSSIFSYNIDRLRQFNEGIKSSIELLKIKL